MLTTEEKAIIQLSDKMHESKQDLLAFIDHYYGDWSNEYQMAKRLVLTQSDVQQYVDMWDGNVERIHNHNLKFRRRKIDQNQWSFDEFADLIVLDSADFIESVYQQEYCDRWKVELDNYLAYGSIRELYQLHKQYPYARLEYLIN